MKRTSLLFLLFAGLMCVADSASQAAAYIKIGDIKGESTDAEHREWSELLSMNFSIVRDLEAGSGRVTPPVAVTFDCAKEIDKSSPLLVEAMTKGTTIPTLIIHFTRPTGEGDETYLKYELKNVLISSYSMNGSAAGDQRPMESFSLNYEEIKVTYTEFDGGAPAGDVEYTWDLAANQES